MPGSRVDFEERINKATLTRRQRRKARYIHALVGAKDKPDITKEEDFAMNLYGVSTGKKKWECGYSLSGT